ncbi:hypothetical protein Ddye_011224 [Dipteronia dyeriana]|uniref:Reverse transcriptase zinc-binding domain-containing protein n=1 Tax=Dipteronia dyeriana TaxID=168575 RepID=A0AAD9UC01_9ROSI|nr:hypothetical protein Ddye_011224 [Dipteronia dyeriana]
MFYEVVIGNGGKADFWESSGGDAVQLKLACPRVFALAVKKKGVIQEFGFWQGSKWVWDIALRRPLFDWEKIQWSLFLSTLENARIRRSILDTLAWAFCPDDKFTVGSFRLCIETPSHNNSVDYKAIWHGICPSKIEIFIWQTLHGRVMVGQVVQNFGLAIASSWLCPLCNQEKESIDHQFLFCPWSWKLWSVCMEWWGVNFCFNKSLTDWFMGWHGLCPEPKFNRGWNTLFAAMLFSVWETRNHCIFQGTQFSVYQVSYMVKMRVAWWFKFYGKGSKLSISTMILNLPESCIELKQVKRPLGGLWNPPSGLGFKFNVGGSSRGNPGSPGIGGVLRDNSGKVLGMFSDDSNLAVSWINSEGFGSLNHVQIIRDICCGLVSLRNDRVSFNPRSSNLFADSLAKKGSGLHGDVLLWDFQ